MTDFDALISEIELRNFQMGTAGSKGKFEFAKENREKARSALREAIAEVVRDNDGFRSMMKSETLESLDRPELIAIIHNMQDERAAKCLEYEEVIENQKKRVEEIEPLVKEHYFDYAKQKYICLHCGAESTADFTGERLIHFAGCAYARYRLSKRGAGIILCPTNSLTPIIALQWLFSGLRFAIPRRKTGIENLQFTGCLHLIKATGCWIISK